MKKLLALALAALMLGGCTTEVPEPTAGETTTPTEEGVISHETLEILSFEYEDVYAAAPMGEDLLLFSGTDDTTLIKISGRNHKEIARLSTGVQIGPDDPTVQVSESGICYPTETALVFLGADLTQIDRVSLSDVWGQGVTAADQKTIYYATGSSLRVYDRETGLDRPLRETTHSKLRLLGLELDDSVAVCQNPDDDTTLFYATANGELLGTYDGSISLKSAGTLWLARIGNEWVLGSENAEPQVLTGVEDPVPVLNGILTRTQAEESVTFQFLNLTEDTAASITLDGSPIVTNAWGGDGVLWFSLNDGRVCRWDLNETGAQEAISCLAPYYSRENPDTEGLSALETVAQELENTYNVKIHMAEDAVSAAPDGASLVSEYRVDALEAGLENLSAALARFNPEFLATAGKASDDGKIHIALVRSMDGGGCFQFWDGDGSARIVLVLGDTVEQNFYHGLAHIIDARVMTRTTSFDRWEKLNPKGFDYDYDYAANAGRDGSAYADAFIDTFAMSFPTEDRARVFEYAMLADSDAHFQSETMQKKLSTLCTGIRKAFQLSDSETPLPWEQYLDQ